MPREIELRDGILFIEQHGVVDEAAARRVLAEELRIVEEERGGKPAPVLVTLDHAETVTAEARRLFAEASAQEAFSRRAAMVGGGVFVRTIANFVIRMSGRQDRNRFFSDRQEAIAWLRNEQDDER